MDHNADAKWSEDELDDKLKDEFDGTAPSFECIPWHNDDMPEFIQEELIEEKQEEM